MTKNVLARPQILLVNTSGRVDFLRPVHIPETKFCQAIFQRYYGHHLKSSKAQGTDCHYIHL